MDAWEREQQRIKADLARIAQENADAALLKAQQEQNAEAERLATAARHEAERRSADSRNFGNNFR